MVTIPMPNSVGSRHAQLAAVAALVVLVALIAVTTWLAVRTGGSADAGTAVVPPSHAPSAGLDCRPTKLVNYC